MNWELRLDRDGFSVEAAIEKDRPLPDWYLEEPEILVHDLFYFRSFNELTSCRQMVQGAFGPIPWTAIVHYAERLRLNYDDTEYFLTVIRALDGAWLKWQYQESKRRMESRT